MPGVPIPPPVSGTINGVDVTILIEGGVVERIPQSGFEATVTFKCAYEKRFQLIQGLRGYTTLIGGKAVRVPPFVYPPLPALICTSIGEIVGIKPRRDANGWLIYKWAILPCNFTFPLYNFDGADPQSQGDPSGQPWTTTRFRASAEVFTPPGGGFIWVYNGLPVEESALGLIRPRVEVSMTRHQLGQVPLDEIMQCEGTVNANPVYLANHVFPRGTLLFGSANTDPGSDGAANYTQDVEYLLLGKYQVEWNELMGRDGDWHLIAHNDGSGDPPFPYLDYPSILP